MTDRIKLEFVGQGPAKMDLTLTGFGLLTVGDQIVVNTEISLCLCQAYPEAFKALPPPYIPICRGWIRALMVI